MATFTPAQLAERFHTDAKSFRIFLRADAKARGIKAPGKGARWAIEGREINSMGARFRAWTRDQEAKRAARLADQAASEIEGPDESQAQLEAQAEADAETEATEES